MKCTSTKLGWFLRPLICKRLSYCRLPFIAQSDPRLCRSNSVRMTVTKRKSETAISQTKFKRPQIKIPEYHTTPSRRDDGGEIVWPARASQIDRAREIISQCARAQKHTVILPDKDADGLSSGAILHHTLTTLGLSSDLISVYFPPKGSNVHDISTGIELSSRSPEYIFILDQGSRKTAALIDSPHTCLVIDHHHTEDGGFPDGSDYVTAHDCPPVATSSLLTYHICLPLDSTLEEKLSWLTAMGTHGDLGTTLKWQPPFPDMTATFKKHTKKAINEAVALINAPRRSTAYNVEDAWEAVITASSPASVRKNKKLDDTLFEVRRETERCTHTPPKFSSDGTIAILTISSTAQIHPVIATRWSGYLKSSSLEVVMCANEGYLPDKVNFSCRVARIAKVRGGDEKIDIIKKLKDLVAGDEHEDLKRRLGESFARGHKEASGGIVGKKEWEELKALMEIGVSKKIEASPKKEKNPTQKNTLTNYFVKKLK